MFRLRTKARAEATRVFVSISIYFEATRVLAPSGILKPRNQSGNGTAVPPTTISGEKAVVWSTNSYSKYALRPIPESGPRQPALNVGDIPQDVEGTQFEELALALFASFAAARKDSHERHGGAAGGAGVVDVVTDIDRVFRGTLVQYLEQ